MATWFVSATGLKTAAATEGAPTSLAQANEQAVAGDLIYLLSNGGDYTTSIQPQRSGVAGQPITYAAYPGHSPRVTKATVDHTVLYLAGRQYIKVKGIEFNGLKAYLESNFYHWLKILGGGHHEIFECIFKYCRGYAGVILDNGTLRNYIHHNLFDECGTYDNGNSTNQDSGDSFKIFNGSYNLIEANTFTHGGHNLGVDQGYRNIWQWNTLDNRYAYIGPNNGGRCGMLGLPASGRPYGEHLVQWNVFRNSLGSSDDIAKNKLTPLIKFAGHRNVLRRNLLYSAAGPWWLGNTRASGDTLNQDCAVVHNLGYDTGSWVEIHDNGVAGRINTGGVYQNNAVWASRQALAYEILINLKQTYPDGTGEPSNGHRFIGNAFGSAVAKARIVDIGTAEILTLQAAHPAVFRDNYTGLQPTFVAGSATPTTLAQCVQTADSPTKAAGQPLTTTVGSGTGTTVVNVADGRYFFDGYGWLPGDLVQIGTQVVRIISKTGLNQFMVDAPVTYTAGTPVSYPYTTAPDIGIDGFVVDETDPDGGEVIPPPDPVTPPEETFTAPTGLQVLATTVEDLALTWATVPGAAYYTLYVDGLVWDTTAAPPAVITGLVAGSTITVTVTATNDAEVESAPSNAVRVRLPDADEPDLSPPPVDSGVYSAQLRAYPPAVRVDATALVVFTGPPGRSLAWSLQGDGQLADVSLYTDAYGRGYARYEPGTVGESVVITVDFGV